MTAKLANLSRCLGYQFKDISLLQTALTHRSASRHHNERLEFLGDSILNHIIAAELFHRFPIAKEGELSRLRSKLVREETLAELAKEFSLGDYLKLGIGELRSGGFTRDSILADAVEAIVGAIYLDNGVEVCRERLLSWFASRLDMLSTVSSGKDAKTRLQEYLQGKRLPLPEYSVKDVQGKSHSQIFHVECRVAGLPYVAKSSGRNRRKAEQEAANKLIKLLKISQ